MGWYTYIWPVIGKVTELARLLLVELFHYAVDFGFGSEQTNTAARILLACSTIDVQGQVITRLREVLYPSTMLTIVYSKDHSQTRQNFGRSSSVERSRSTFAALFDFVVRQLATLSPIFARDHVYHYSHCRLWTGCYSIFDSRIPCKYRAVAPQSLSTPVVRPTKARSHPKRPVNCEVYSIVWTPGFDTRHCVLGLGELGE